GRASKSITVRNAAVFGWIAASSIRSSSAACRKLLRPPLQPHRRSRLPRFTLAVDRTRGRRAATRTAVTVMAQDTAATAASHTRNARVGWRKSSTEECQMHETTTADRERELRTLLDLIEAHPERAWTEERQRVAVLQRMLAANSES